jgi:hypothetical protein
MFNPNLMSKRLRNSNLFCSNDVTKEPWVLPVSESSVLKKRCYMKPQLAKHLGILLFIVGLGWMGLATRATGQDQPVVSLKEVLSAKNMELQPLASRFDMKGKRAVVVEVVLSGPDRVVAISSSDFVFRYKADSKDQTVPCIGLYKGYGIWDLASQGPVTDDRNFNKEPKQQLLFLIPTDIAQGYVLLKGSAEAVEVKTILTDK